MNAPKPSDLRLIQVGTAEHAGAFAALQFATPTGRLRRVDLTEAQALEVASVLLAIAAQAARKRGTS